MTTEQARVDGDGQIVIPAAFRDALGLKDGDVLTVRMDEHGLHLQTVRQWIEEARGLIAQYAGPERCLSDELIAERRLEFAREEQ